MNYSIENEINKKLLSFYQSKWNQISAILSSNEKISYPLILSVPDGYMESKTKLMVVGQQPYGWGFKKGVGRDSEWNSTKILMQKYRDFNFGDKYIRTPFWQAVHELHNCLNPLGPANGFLWSNLIAIDEWDKRPQAVEESICQLGLLSEEIKITQPDTIVFFTGPNYDERLGKTFNGLELEKIDNNDSRKLAVVKHAFLPARSFRTYHPNYLRRQNHWQYVNEIADLIKNGTRPDPRKEQNERMPSLL